MCRLICHRFVALAVAYAVALNLVVPLLAAFALAADSAPASLAELCAPDQSGAGPGAGHPSGHAPLCPLGMTCPAQDCGANGFLATAPSSVATFALGLAPSLVFIRLGDKTLVPPDIGAQFARAPPLA